MTATQRLAWIRRMLTVAMQDYGARPTDKNWRLDNDELRAIYRLTRPKPRRRKTHGTKR